ncbi:hypothetical protein TWF696_002488 [Orbilia brochopaga]|uniref:Uncharacterized protein n=1 Tax=Orbilia brochopaga TaxID=3140254 RepID=A0AAV9U5T5_9PEZI
MAFSTRISYTKLQHDDVEKIQSTEDNGQSGNADGSWSHRLSMLLFFKGHRQLAISRALLGAVSLVLVGLIIYVLNIDKSSVSRSYLPVDEVVEDTDRPLVLYAYHETDNAKENALFFINHGLHDAADFVFIINGESTLKEHIPVADHISIVERENECYDLGAYGHVLTANNSYLVDNHKRFILMNASIRGPFLPTWSSDCWSEAYLNKVTDTNKLVGMSFNCRAPGGPHVQSMIMATDRIGVQILLRDVITHCFSGWDDAVTGEMNITQAIRKAGYSVTAFMTAFSSDKDYPDTCEHGDILWNDKYYETNIHPYEMMFQKANRDIYPKQLEMLTEWHDKMKYSSQKFCGKDRKVKFTTLGPL